MARPSTIILTHPKYLALADDFYTYQLHLGYESKSSYAKYLYVKAFLFWQEQQGYRSITQIGTPQIEAYYQYLQQRLSKNSKTPLKAKSIQGHIRAIRDLFVMLEVQEVICSNPFSTLCFSYKKVQSNRIPLSQSEIQCLYDSCQTAQQRAILSLAYGCGLRTGEMVRLNIEHLRLREKLLIVAKGKGNKRRAVPLSSGVVEDLAAYLYGQRSQLSSGRDYHKNKRDNQRAFMLHARGSRMQAYTYNKYLKTIVEQSGKQGLKDKAISIHHLRHSIATHLIEKGIAVEQVRLFLGHTHLETTQIYTHISQQQLAVLLNEKPNIV